MCGALVTCNARPRGETRGCPDRGWTTSRRPPARGAGSRPARLRAARATTQTGSAWAIPAWAVRALVGGLTESRSCIIALPQALSCTLKNSSPSRPVWSCSHAGAAPQRDVESLCSMQWHQFASPVGASRMEELGTATEEVGLLPARAAIAVRQSDALRKPAR